MPIATPHRVRMTAAEERAVALEIRAAERETLAAIKGIPEAEKVLRRPAPRPEATRAGEVDRLRDAVEAVATAQGADRDLVRKARAAWQRSHDLRWRLALSASHVVPPIARQISSARVDPDDLVNEGLIGLHRAAKRFDPDQGVRFATYARWWARAQMTRAVDRGGRPIRLPGGAVEARRHLMRLVAEREAALQPWTIAELAEEVGLTVPRVAELLSPPEVGSLDAPSGDDGSRSLLDQLADPDVVAADDDAGDRQMAERLRTCLDKIGDVRLRTILASRFGLDGTPTRTLREIGDELGLSRERVRQLEATAIAWLRQQLEPDLKIAV
jgi:RNA polymerase primary sigma factor